MKNAYSGKSKKSSQAIYSSRNHSLVKIKKQKFSQSEIQETIFNRQIHCRLYLFRKKIIIELDGWQHKEENQERYDQERNRFLEKCGLRILRFWNNEVNDNLEGVMIEIEKLIK